MKKRIWAIVFLFPIVLPSVCPAVIFQEDFESYSIGQNYTDWDRINYNNYGVIKLNSELNSKVLEIGEGFQNYWFMPNGTNRITFECDFLFNAKGDPTAFSNSIVFQSISGCIRESSDFGAMLYSSTSNKLFSYSDNYNYNNSYVNYFGEIQYNHWYHLIRVYDLNCQMETMKLLDKISSEELISFSYDFPNNRNVISAIGFFTYPWGKPCLLIDNIKIIEAPEPATMLLLGFGGLLIRRRK